jgi:predicted regulator of Ras-like GTPase activity (Roadblock/LC7/MglB family)
MVSTGGNSPLTQRVASLRDKLEGILGDLSTATRGVDGATLVRLDGLIVSCSPGLSDDSMAAAMSAALLNISRNVVRQLKLGALTRVVVSGTKGDVVLTRTQNDMILSIFLRKEASLGMTFLQLGRTSEKISQILTEKR